MNTAHQSELEKTSTISSDLHNTIKDMLDLILQTLNNLQKEPRIIDSTPVKVDLLDLKNALLALRPADVELESWGFVFSDPLEGEINESLDYFIPRLSALTDQTNYQNILNMGSYVVRAVAELKRDYVDILREILLLISYLQDIIEMLILECRVKMKEDQEFQRISLINSEYQDKIKSWWRDSPYKCFQENIVQPERMRNNQFIQVSLSKGHLPEITLKLEKLLEQSMKRLSLIGQLHPNNTDNFLGVHAFLHNARCHYNSFINPIANLNKTLVLCSTLLTPVKQVQKEGDKNENVSFSRVGRNFDPLKQKAVPTFGTPDHFTEMLRGNAAVTTKSGARKSTESPPSPRRASPRQFGSLGRNTHLKLDLSTLTSSSQPKVHRKTASVDNHSKYDQTFFDPSQQSNVSGEQLAPNSQSPRKKPARRRGSIPVIEFINIDAGNSQENTAKALAKGSPALSRSSDESDI